jgi:hypothetical protein
MRCMHLRRPSLSLISPMTSQRHPTRPPPTHPPSRRPAVWGTRHPPPLQARTANFSSMLRRLFEDSQDLVLLEVAATALGHLVRSGGPMMADVVERQVGRHWGSGCEVTGL